MGGKGSGGKGVGVVGWRWLVGGRQGRKQCKKEGGKRTREQRKV